jgi:hypothetical protein
MVKTLLRALRMVLRLWWRLTVLVFVVVFGLFFFQFAVANRALRVAGR